MPIVRVPTVIIIDDSSRVIVPVVHALLEELRFVRLHRFERGQGLRALVVAIISSGETNERAQIETVQAEDA